MRYPSARRLDTVDEIHGRLIPDPYRWLEDPASAETRGWNGAQDALAQPFLESLPQREHFRRRLAELLPGSISPPTVLGRREFFSRRMPGQDHPVYYVREDGEERALIDPNTLSEDKTITLDAVSPSIEGDLLAYQLSQGGNEESVLWVMDVTTGEVVDGPIDRCRYSPVAWLPGGEVFYYVRKLPPGEVPAGEEQLHRRVYRHRVRAASDADEIVFGQNSLKTTYFGVNTSRDGRWLIVTSSLGTAPRNDLYLADLHAGATFVTVVEGADAQTHARVHRDGRIYILTDLDAPRWRLAVADPAAPHPNAWRDLLPESESVLDGYTLTDDAVVAVRTRHAVSDVSVHDLQTGTLRSQVELPGLGSAAVTSRPEGGDDAWIVYTDHVTPSMVLHYTVATQELRTWATAPGAVATEQITAKQAFYPSRDGTQIPVFVISRDDVELDGRRPAILYGYGGFNVAMTPSYSSSILAWAELGGVYAIANLRGGSEYGEPWHRAGMREHKQNVFDDFIAAGEWLIGAGYTAPAHLGISGGSNGGLLVGAALTQRPDLFRAVVCSAPLLDMVRYEHFGLGVTWNDEYGTADDPQELGWLVSYSPYHRVQEGTAYPAVLFTIFESDTRVDPMHARKMCAALQHATSSGLPVLLRRETKVGHGGRSVTRTIELGADTSAFLAHELGLST